MIERVFYFDGIVFTANRSKSLVEVRKMQDTPPYLSNIEDLPEWVFNCRLAVWTGNERVTLYHRSVARKKIMKLLLRHSPAEING